MAETVLYSPQTLVIKCRHLYRVAVAECLRVEEEEASIAGIGKVSLQSPPELAKDMASSESNVSDTELNTASPLVQGANNESSKAASREKSGFFQSHNDDNQTSVLTPWWRELVSRVMAVTDDRPQRKKDRRRKTKALLREMTQGTADNADETT